MILTHFKTNGIRASLLCLGAVFVLLLSCCNNKVVEEGESPKRNILFYIGGDNNLSSEAIQKINEMRYGWKPGAGEMIIYLDGKNEGAFMLRINDTKGTDNNGVAIYGLDTVQVRGSENSADAEVLNQVINKFTTDFPADSYGMIFFSHASGWLPEGTLSRPRSMVIDGGTGTNREMEYYDFAGAIPDGRFDFIILESCLMADVMSMYELRNKAEYVMASSAEILSPGFTDIYGNKTMGLFNTAQSVDVVLKAFAQSYYDVITTAYPDENDDYCSLTMSIIKAKEMENLAAAAKVALQGKSIDQTTLTVDSIQTFDRPKELISSSVPRHSRYFDLGHTIDSLATKAQYEAFETQLNKTVVWKAATKRFLYYYNGFLIKRHSGLTTYIKQDDYPFLNSTFENSSWYKAIY
ncbi:MAG: hypothetical protein LBT42_02710 [Tannerella sp.]|nr:hypothetical protein [Tannerella sp.]